MKIRLRVIVLLLGACAPIPLMAQNTTASPASSSGIDAVHMPPHKLTAFEQQLLDTQKALLDAMNGGDAAYVRNAIADNFVVITTNGDPGGKGELLEYAGAHKDHKDKPTFYDFQVVELADNAAVVTYNVVFPTHIERYQHLSDTWVKEGNQWKLKFRQTTLNLWSAHDL